MIRNKNVIYIELKNIRIAIDRSGEDQTDGFGTGDRSISSERKVRGD